MHNRSRAVAIAKTAERPIHARLGAWLIAAMMIALSLLPFISTI